MFDAEKICDLQAQMFQDIPATQGVNLDLLVNILNQDELLSPYNYSAQVAFDIILKKPFNSFNKRVALIIITLDLEKNGYEFTANPSEQLFLLSEIENGNMSVSQIIFYIMEHCKVLQS